MRSRTVLSAAAVLFDMDGTLTDSTALVERLWTDFAAEHDLPVAELLAYSHGRQTLPTLQHVLPGREEADYAAIIATMEDPAAEATGGVVAVPGALEFYHSIPPHRRAIVTSATRALATVRLQRLGFTLPEVFVTAESTPESKPHPAPYAHAAAALGYPPEQCLVVEDAAAGVQSALAAGCQLLIRAGTMDITAPGVPQLPDLRGITVEVPEGNAALRLHLPSGI